MTDGARNRSQASSCFYCGCGFTPSGARQRTVDHRSPSSLERAAVAESDRLAAARLNGLGLPAAQRFGTAAVDAYEKALTSALEAATKAAIPKTVLERDNTCSPTK